MALVFFSFLFVVFGAIVLSITAYEYVQIKKYENDVSPEFYSYFMKQSIANFVIGGVAIFLGLYNLVIRSIVKKMK